MQQQTAARNQKQSCMADHADIAHVEVSNASGGDSGHCLNKVQSLTHRVNGHHNSIIAT